MPEINEVLYPRLYDTERNFPSTVEITESSGEDVTRNRDAIIRLEHVLGLNPQIGIYTTNPLTATVNERIALIENGIAEGRFAYRNLNVNNVLLVNTDAIGHAYVYLGGSPTTTVTAPVYVKGPFRVQTPPSLQNNQAIFDVPVEFNSRKNIMQTASYAGEPILRITDTNPDPEAERYALQIDGNVLIRNGRLVADMSVSHSQLRDISTTPVGNVATNVIHVARGDYHSHKRKKDVVTGALLNQVDPNPAESTYGLIDHKDLLSIQTKANQTEFIPTEGTAYHVTGGDEHDHKNGRGAQIDHGYLMNINPSYTNHVTSGDAHTHSTATGDGGSTISHNDLMQVGFLSHTDIDRLLNVDFREHLTLIDPASADEIDTAYSAYGYHVPQGHVSDPNAHHTRYTDQEAISAQVSVSGSTGSYQEGQNTSPQSHIQALGTGVVSVSNPHGTSSADIGALEGFDSQGNLPDATKQIIQSAVGQMLLDPTFSITKAEVDEVISGLWTFQNANGIMFRNGPSSIPTTFLTYNNVLSVVNDLPVVINHVSNATTGVLHPASKIQYDPITITNPFTVSENVQDALTDVSVHSHSIMAYTFNDKLIGTGGTEVRRYGIKLPAGTEGEVLSVSVMKYTSSGAPTSLTIDVEINGTSIFTVPFNINSYVESLPVELALAGTAALTAADILKVNVDMTGTSVGTNLTVVVHCKMKHIEA